MALNTVSSDRLSTNVKNTNFTAAEKQALTDDIYIIRNAPVPAGSSLEIISGSKIIMESSDVLRVRSGTATALDVAVSYLEQT